MNLKLLSLLSLAFLLFLGCGLNPIPLERTSKIPYSFEEIDLNSVEVKTINVIYHVFNDTNGQGNFQDTLPDREWLIGKIKQANQFLSNVESPKPLVGNYIKDSKIRVRLVDIKFYNSANGAKATVRGEYSHRDLYRDFVTENPNLTEFERTNCVHLLLSGVKPRAYGGRNICLQRGCKDGFGFQNNVLYFEGMYQVYTKEFDFWGVGGHIIHEMGHGLGLGHYDTRYGPCTDCEGAKPCRDGNNFMKANNGGKGMTECQMKLMHHLLEFGPRDSTMINPNSRAHFLIKELPAQLEPILEPSF